MDEGSARRGRGLIGIGGAVFAGAALVAAAVTPVADQLADRLRGTTDIAAQSLAGPRAQGAEVRILRSASQPPPGSPAPAATVALGWPEALGRARPRAGGQAVVGLTLVRSGAQELAGLASSGFTVATPEPAALGGDPVGDGTEPGAVPTSADRSTKGAGAIAEQQTDPKGLHAGPRAAKPTKDKAAKASAGAAGTKGKGAKGKDAKGKDAKGWGAKAAKGTAGSAAGAGGQAGDRTDTRATDGLGKDKAGKDKAGKDKAGKG